MDRKKENIGKINTFLGGVLWGISGTLGAYLFTRKNLTSDWLVPYRLLLSGAIMIVYLYFRDKKSLFKIWKNKLDALKLIAFGVLGMLGVQYTYFTTIEYSNAGIATVLQYFGPTLILLYVCMKEKRLPKKYEVVALLLSIFGVFILATHGNVNSLQVSLKTLVWGMMSAIALVVYTVQPVELIKKYGANPVVAWGMFIGGVVLAFFLKPWTIQEPIDFTILFVLLMIVIFGTIISFVLYLTGVTYIGPAKGSMIACIEPVSATIFSTLFLKTRFTFIDIIGFIFVLSTVFIVAKYGSENKK